MNRVNKKKLVSYYSKLFDNHSVILLVRNLGLSVSESRYISSQFKKIDSKFMVIKNSLAKIALDTGSFTSIKSLFKGPVIVIYSEDMIAVSKLLIKISNDNDNLDVIGGAISNKCLDKDDVIALSNMLTEDEIRAKIISLVNAVTSNVVRVLNEPSAKLVRVIRSYATKQ